jgi:hypothetical protein
MKDEIEEENQSKKNLRNKTNSNPKNNDQIEYKKTKMIHLYFSKENREKMEKEKKKIHWSSIFVPLCVLDKTSKK